jgi:hypothetical protein
MTQGPVIGFDARPKRGLNRASACLVRDSGLLGTKTCSSGGIKGSTSPSRKPEVSLGKPGRGGTPVRLFPREAVHIICVRGSRRLHLCDFDFRPTRVVCSKRTISTRTGRLCPRRRARHVWRKVTTGRAVLQEEPYVW